VLDPLYEVITRVILVIHAGLSVVFRDPKSGPAWALSIVLLTVVIRLLLFPLFVKQIRAQRAMQTLQPRIKELQAKHKGDREALNRETMALYKNHGANPVAGCLPLILQLPVFYALFHVLRTIRPDGPGLYGFTREQVNNAAHAKIFGAPIAAAFSSPTSLLHELNASPTSVKTLAVILIVLMGLTTFFTQKQMMSRTGPVDPTQAMTQKVLLYVMPFSFAIFGFQFPLGVLLYWLTTNLWSMGQQFFVIRRMPPPALAGTPAGPAVATKMPPRTSPASRLGFASGSRPAARENSSGKLWANLAGRFASKPQPPVGPAPAAAAPKEAPPRAPKGSSGRPGTPAVSGPPARAIAGARSNPNVRRRKGRRGGRH
jgi:YidC/Oxa1 family membrane protein insertase